MASCFLYRRREVIALIGAAAAAWPLAARAQQPGKLPLVGFAAASVRRRPQACLGYSEGRNIALEVRYSG
jgi:putative ABC transport system substrate-binding protein